MPESTATETVKTETTETKPEAKAETTEAKTYSEEHVKAIHAENAARRKEAADLKAQLERERQEASELKEYKLKREQEEAEKKGEYDKALKLEKEARKEAEKARDAAHHDRVLAKAEALAIKAGIRDEALDDLVLRPELKSAKMEDLPEIIKTIKEAKGFWFADAAPPAKEAEAEKKPVVKTPERSGENGKTSLDWSKLDDRDLAKNLKQKYGFTI